MNRSFSMFLLVLLIEMSSFAKLIFWQGQCGIVSASSKDRISVVNLGMKKMLSQEIHFERHMREILCGGNLYQMTLVFL